MVKDLNKSIGTSFLNGITYNYLNLPLEVKFNNSSTQKINYIYDATGVKLEKKVTEGSTITRTLYAGNHVYQGLTGAETLKFFNHSEGYIEPVNPSNYGSGFNYVYQYKDHLGNIRLSYQDVNQNNASAVSLQILEENNYYPFGLEHKGYNTNVTSTNIAQQFTFNGQQFDKSLGLNMSEMVFRQYDPAIGRFNVVDPLAENYHNLTPYRFGFNNPIVWSDPSGLIEESVVLDIFRRSNHGDKWYNDGHSGFYTDNGGYVGYTSDDTSFNRSPGEITNLPAVEVNEGDDMSYRMAAWKTESAIYGTRWYNHQRQYFSQGKMSLTQKWSNSDNLFASMSYGILNDAFQVVQTVDGDLIPVRTNPLTGSRANINIDGSANYKPVDGVVNTATLALPFARAAKGATAVLPKGLGYLQKFNAAQFSQKFKGSLSRLAPKYRGVLNRLLNKGVNSYNNQVSNGLITLKALWLAPDDE